VIERIWKTKPKTAIHIRGCIERILDYATAIGYREGENPARWRGNLEFRLPRLSKLRRPEPLAAMSYSEIPAFVAQLRGQEGIPARALEFILLTATRASEVTKATWDQIDLA
jgi:integrase